MGRGNMRVSPAECERFFGISRARINRWAHRGKLIRHGRRNGQPLYFLGDIEKLNVKAANDYRSTERKAVEV